MGKKGDEGRDRLPPRQREPRARRRAAGVARNGNRLEAVPKGKGKRVLAAVSAPRRLAWRGSGPGARVDSRRRQPFLRSRHRDRSREAPVHDRESCGSARFSLPKSIGSGLLLSSFAYRVLHDAPRFRSWGPLLPLYNIGWTRPPKTIKAKGRFMEDG